MADSPLILVVDDDDVLSETTATALRHSGYRVRTATNGLDALYLLQAADSVSLVILDLLMPVLDGWELADELRGWRDDLPLLVVSGARGDVADSARDLGAAGFMEKPFDLNDLLDTVHALVRAA